MLLFLDLNDLLLVRFLTLVCNHYARLLEDFWFLVSLPQASIPLTGDGDFIIREHILTGGRENFVGEGKHSANCIDLGLRIFE